MREQAVEEETVEEETQTPEEQAYDEGFEAGFEGEEAENKFLDKHPVTDEDDDDLESEAVVEQEEEQPEETEQETETEPENSETPAEDESEESEEQEVEQQEEEALTGGDELQKQIAAAVKVALEENGLANIPRRLRAVEGHYGSIKSEIQKLVSNAETATINAGGATPSQEEVAAAAESKEKFERLQSEYPEFAEALQDQADSTKKDLEELRTEINDKPSLSEGDVDKRVQRGVLETLHPDVDFDKLATDSEYMTEFRDWVEGELDKGDESFEALVQSPLGKDGAKVLALWKESLEDGAQSDNETETETEDNGNRLEESIPATEGTSHRERKKSASYDDDFETGFNET